MVMLTYQNGKIKVIVECIPPFSFLLVCYTYRKSTTVEMVNFYVFCNSSYVIMVIRYIVASEIPWDV